VNKDFDSWNNLKKNIHLKEVGVFCNVREVWWASIGLNIGSEEDGKNEMFERPVLIIKVFNKSMLRIIPLTSTVRNNSNHVPIRHEGVEGSVILSQLKTISAQRLTRKLCRLPNEDYKAIIERLRDNLV
jgi:mRNA-degrading endonuclease toxin of MazEF toxin-antitoxin module